MPTVAPEVPRVQQTLCLSHSKLEALHEWAVNGSGVTAAARVTDSDTRIALIRNRWTDGWFLPGGAVEASESPREAARREVREETGLVGSIESPLVVLDQTYVSEKNDEKWFSAIFIVYAASAEGEIPDASQLGETDDEIQAARWFDTLPDNLHDGNLLRQYL